MSFITLQLQQSGCDWQSGKCQMGHKAAATNNVGKKERRSSIDPTLTRPLISPLLLRCILRLFNSAVLDKGYIKIHHSVYYHIEHIQLLPVSNIPHPDFMNITSRISFPVMRPEHDGDSPRGLSIRHNRCFCLHKLLVHITHSQSHSQPDAAVSQPAETHEAPRSPSECSSFLRAGRWKPQKDELKWY